MPDIEDEIDGQDVTEPAPQSVAKKRAWQQTVEDMRAIADERREQGWTAVAIPVGHTAPVGKEAGTDDTFGIVHVIPDNHVDAFTEAYGPGEFPRFEVYRHDEEGSVFIVTEFLDPETETTILLAGMFDIPKAEGMYASVKEEGVLYTHVKTLDGTHHGTFVHEEYDAFLPHAEGRTSG